MVLCVLRSKGATTACWITETFLPPLAKPHKNQTPLPAPDPQLHTDLWDCPRGPELIICSMCMRMIDGTGMAYVSVKYCVVKVVPIYVCETGLISLAFLKVANLSGRQRRW